MTDNATCTRVPPQNTASPIGRPDHPALTQLARQIGTAIDRPPDDMAKQIRDALHAAVTGERWLPPERRRANHEVYARHLLYADLAGRFSILSLVWDFGQQSPIHGHKTWCAVGVYDGELTETLYREREDGGTAEVGVNRRTTGSVTFGPALSQIHSIGNHSGGVSISLHVYGVSAGLVTTGINQLYAQRAITEW